HFFNAVNGLDNHYASSKVELGKAFIANHQIDPSKTLMVGDTTHDADVAAEMGVDCCLIPNGHQSQKTLLSRNVPIAHSLSVLLEL
ncbi:MAG: HAD hydrolase-like protein, partial [Anaerolineaceae bacterium]|nr:HAD hydrolase-like protein [Anaerolineaceae bacterium]